MYKLLIALLVLSIAIKSYVFIEGIDLNEATYKYSSIIRVNEGEGTICTAIVINDKMAIGAAHCLLGGERYLYVSDINRTHKQYLPVQTSTYHDLAVIYGDFREYAKANLKKYQNGIEGDEGPHKSCGFAYGGNLLCFKIENARAFRFKIKGDGTIYGAMSGGPLYNSKGEVVGINYAMADDYSIFTPIVNFDNNFGVKN